MEGFVEFWIWICLFVGSLVLANQSNVHSGRVSMVHITESTESTALTIFFLPLLILFFYIFYHHWQFLTIFDSLRPFLNIFDHFDQFWQFLTVLVFFDNFLVFSQFFLTVFYRLWPFVTVCDNFWPFLIFLKLFLTVFNRFWKKLIVFDRILLLLTVFDCCWLFFLTVFDGFFFILFWTVLQKVYINGWWSMDYGRKYRKYRKYTLMVKQRLLELGLLCGCCMVCKMAVLQQNILIPPTDRDPDPLMAGGQVLVFFI